MYVLSFGAEMMLPLRRTLVRLFFTVRGALELWCSGVCFLYIQIHFAAKLWLHTYTFEGGYPSTSTRPCIHFDLAYAIRNYW